MTSTSSKTGEYASDIEERDSTSHEEQEYAVATSPTLVESDGAARAHIEVYKNGKLDAKFLVEFDGKIERSTSAGLYVSITGVTEVTKIS